MGKLRKQNSNLPAFPRITPEKTETFAGKWTARVTKIFNQPDGSIIKATRKIFTEVTSPKSIVSANSTTGAYTGELRRKRPSVA